MTETETDKREQSPVVEIRGRNGIVLRKFVPGDRQGAIELHNLEQRNQEEIMTAPDAERLGTEDEILESFSNDRVERFGIRTPEELSGLLTVAFHEDEDDETEEITKGASIGYLVDKAKTGQDIATDALASMTDYIFSVTDVTIITAHTYEYNTASQRVLEKAGFKKINEQLDMKSHQIYFNYVLTKINTGEKITPTSD